MGELKDWITTNIGIELTDYSQAYIRQLARAGRIRSRKMARDWLVHKGDLLAHKEKMDRLGEQKHNPWRESLGRERGRQS